MNTFRRIAVLAVLTLAIASVAQAAAFTPGNIVVYRVGDGVTALSGNAAPVFLDEYTPAGVFVQSVAMPTTGSGANLRLTASGSATTEGFLSRSQDGQYLIVPGYDAAPATASITTSTTIARVMGRVDSTGAVDTTSSYIDSASAGNIRSATSLDGTRFWASGSTQGIRTVALGGSGAATIVSSTATNLRQIGIFNNQLYIGSGAGTIRMGTVGSGTPITTGNTMTSLPGFPTAAPTAVNGYFFADLNAGVAGVDTLYVSDEGNSVISKWSLVSGTWTANGTIALATARGLTGSVAGSTVTLYATGGAAGTPLVTLTDSSGYNATITGSVTTLVASAGTNKAFRAVALVPVSASPAPTVSTIVRANANPTNAASVDFTVTFSQSVTGVDSSDFSLTTTGVAGASVSGVTGSGTTYTVSVNTGTGSGTIRLDVTDNDSIINGSSTPLGGAGAGNGNFTTGETYTIDKTPPVVQSIVRASTNPTNAASVNFTVSFGESVVGLDTTDFSLTTTGVSGASVSGVTGSGPYTVSVNTGSGDGTIRLDFTSNGSVTDSLGNANVTSFNSGEVYTIDKSGPTVVSSVRANADPTSASSVDFTVTFSESVTGVDTSDFSTTNTGAVTGTSVTGVTGSGTTYTVTVNTGTGASGTVRLDVNNGASIQDAVGNALASGFTSGEAYTIDRNAPTVVSITRNDPNPNNTASVSWTVTFSESVTGVDSGDFALVPTSVSGTSITGVTGSGTTYTVTANTGSGDGTLGLNLVDNDSIQDTTAVPLGGAGANNGDFTGEVYTIDKTAPAVQSITRANGNPNRNATVDFNVTFTESVTGVTTSNFALVMSGVSGATISGVTGSGATRVVTVNTGTGDGTLRLDQLSGAGVTDAAGNGLTAPFTSGETYTIDKTPPIVVSVTRVDPNPTAAATVDFLVTFSEAVTGSSIADYTLTTTGVSGASVGPINGSGSTRTVTVNTGSGDGTIRLDVVTGGTLIDLAGNLFNTPFSSGEVYTVDKPIAAPTGLVGAVSSGKVALSWNAVTGATSYNVKRSTTPGGPYSTINSPVITNYNDTSVTNGTRYYYVVTAFDGTESPNSNEVHAKPDVPAALGVDISQVYGAGGNTGAVYTNDFIELFNRGNSVVDLTGWSVQYASAAGSTWTPTVLSGTIAPGRHYLIGEGAGAGGTTPLPTPDASGSIAMSGTAGKVALVAVSSAITGTCPTGLVDLAGYGSTASCFEGAGPTPNPNNNANSQNRAGNGCVDTNNNASDFTNAAANPRNTASAATPCLLTAIGIAIPSSVPSGSSVLLKVELPPSTITGVVTADLTSIGGSPTQALFDNATNGDATAGDNIFSVSGTATGSAGVKTLPVSANTATPPSAANTTILLTITPPLETIAAVKVDTTPADTVPDRLGQAVLIRGVVTSIDFRGGTGIEYYIQDPTGGIDVFNTSDVGPALPVGSEVEVNGTLAQFNGLTEITPISVTTLPSGTLPSVTPQTVTLAQLLDGVGEPLEGTLIRVDNLTVSSGSFPASGASGNVTVTDGSNSGTIRVDSDTDIDGTTAPGGIFSVVGLVSQSDTTNPFSCCYQILPRSTADIIPRTPPTGSGAANPPSVAPGGTTLLTIAVTLGQNPPSTGVTVVANLTLIGLSGSQAFVDNGTNGDVAPGDGVYSYSAIVDNATPLGPKSLPFQINDAEGRSSSGSISLNIQSPSAPPTPTNLVATPGNGQVSLTWNPSAGATGYNVKRSTVNGGPYSTIAPNHGTNSYTDTTVTNSIHYYYVVSALIGANESGDSAQADAIPSAPPPAPGVKIYFVDIGQGASTLIVSPSGKSMLVDGGPGGAGTTELTSTLNAAIGPSGKIDYLVLTHYHVDHDAGLTDIINAGRVSPTGIAYDNGDGANVVPPVPTNSTGTAYTAYKNALSAQGITRQTAVPGTTVDLGSGVRATFMAAGGVLASGGHIYVSGTDLNSTSVSTLIEYNNFDFLVSGDMTGGGQTTTAKTPDVETFVAQMTGDVDFVQLDHHGSTTANGRRFLSQLKAESSLASVGATNTFGHPNRETANRYLNIPVTSGNTYGGETLPLPGNGPVFYQTDPSPATDNRTTVQGYSGADQAHAGLGTILLNTDGLVSFTMESFDDGGARISPNAHVYALDPTGGGVATDFPPTVIPYVTPGVPTAADTVTVTALVNDNQAITSVTLNYSLNGAAQAPVTMSPTVGSEYAGSIPAQPNGTRVDYSVTAVANGLSTTYAGGYFSGTTTIATLRSLTALAEPAYLDYAARVSGLVTSGTGKFSSTNNDDYIDDGTGALNISRTIEPTSPATTPTSAGNTYTVAGFINQLTGRFRLDVTPPFDGVDKPWGTPSGFNPYSITSTGSAAVTPISRTIAQLNANGESDEAKLVTIANCSIVSGSIPGSGGVDTFIVITDGTGQIEMKIDGDSNIPGMGALPATFSVTGIVQQDDFLRPFTTRYDVAPRDRTDLGGTNSTPLITIAEAREDIDPSTQTSPDDYVPDRLGQQVKIRGVVTSVDFRGASGTEIYIQDPTGGVDVFSTSINTTFNIGDNLEVTGTVSQFNGLTEIAPASASDITILPGGTLPNPVMEVVTLAQLQNGGAGEAFEGKLIRVNNVTLVSPPATFAANTNYNITDGTFIVQMRIDSDTDIDGTAPPAGTFSVIGVLGQFDNASPFDSGYQLFPRIRATDFPGSVAAAASINAVAGTPQTANVNTTFSTAMQASVSDSGAAPIDGIGVTFTAPTTGASGSFGNNSNTITVATNASGIATAPPFTANNLPGTYNVVASAGAVTADFTLTNFDPSATHFSISAPASVTQGVPFSITVTALNGDNVTATSYTGTVHFTSSSAGTLPSDYTFIAGDNGVHTFTNAVTLTSTGSQSITATDTVNASITGTTNTTVDQATTHFSVSAPANVTNGTAFNVTVTALDASNATVALYAGTVHFTSSSTGTLPSDYTFTGGDAGSHTFSVTLTQSGTQSITATDTVTASITGTTNTNVSCPAIPTPTISGGSQFCTGNTVTLTSSSATGNQWYLNGNPIGGATNQTYDAGNAGGYTVIVTINGCSSASSATHNVINPTPGPATITANSTLICAGGTVVLSSSSATGIQWYRDGNPIPGANSQNYFATVAGSYHVILNALGCPSAPSNTIVLTASANPAPNATITAPASVPQGSSGNVASVADAGAGATYTWLVSAGNVTSGAGTNSITFSPVSTATVNIQVTVTIPGGCSDTKTASVTVTGNGPVTHFSVSAPANVTNGTPFNVTVTALDAGNATVPSYTGTVHFTSSSTGTLPGDYTFVGADNGAHTFSVTLTQNGTQSITATDTVTASITGTTNTNVAAPPATHFSVSAPANVTNGTPFNVTVTALDASNATATGYTGTVHFTSSSTGTLPADYTFVAGDNGVHTFSVTLTQSGAQSVTATDTVTPSITGTANTTVNCPALSVTASNNGPVCAPATVNLSASSPNPGVSYSWTGPGGFTSNAQNPTGVSVSGTYTVTITFNGCTATSSTNVVITSAASATITAPNTVCANNSYNASAPAGATTYNWSITNGSITSGAGTNAITFTSGTTGTTTLNLTVSSGSCNASSSKAMPISSPPSANVPTRLSICGPGTITIPVTLFGTAPFSITWNDGVVQSGINTKSTTRSLTIAANTTRWITSITDASCTSGTDSKHVLLEIDGAIVVTTPPTDQYVANGATATFSVVATGGNLHYHWYYGNVGDTTTEVGLPDSPTFTTWPIHGIEKFWLRITNSCGTVDSAQFIATNSQTRRRATSH